jgi:hypothetical protein
LDSLSRVHIYDLNLSPFLEKGDRRSDGTPLQSKPLTQRVPYGKDLRVKTILRHNIGTIKKWQIKLISPENNCYVLSYSYDSLTLSSSLTWLNGSLYNNTFKNDPLISKERNISNYSDLSWNDFIYKVNCDELGQWDIYTTAYYLDESEYTHKTSFMCEVLYPGKTLNTNLSNPQGICLDEGNLLCIRANNKMMRYQENFDTYMADILNDRVIFRDLYDEVEVEYE